MIDRPTEHLQPPPPGARTQKGGRHGLMMIACCIPMLAIAIVLVATGVAGVSFIFAAVACTAMMALMMRGMNHGDMNHGDMNHGPGTDREGLDHSGMEHSGSRPLAPPPETVSGRPNDR